MTHEPLLTLTHSRWWARLVLAAARPGELARAGARRLAPSRRSFHSASEQRAFEDELRRRQARARLGLPL